MTTPSTARKAGPFNGTGAQTTFPFAFKVFATSDVRVVMADAAGNETVLTLGAQYTVALNSNQETSPGGTITYPVTGAPLPVGGKLSVIGNLPYDQPLDLPSGGNFSPLALENQLDRATIQIQQLKEQVDRAAKVPVTYDTADLEAFTTDVVRLADSADNIDTVADNIAAVDTVAADIAVVAENLDGITNFADVYYGPSATDPITRRDGSALRGGDLYFNTGTQRMRLRASDIWVDGVANTATTAVQVFSGTGAQTAFTLSVDPVSESNTQVFIGGVYQQKGTYSVSGTTLTFSVAPPSGTNNIEVVSTGTVAGFGVLPAGAVSFDQTLNYAVGTLGGYINDDAVSPASFPWLAAFNGTTDDTAAIQACFTYAASNGRSVKFPDGQFALITDTLNFPATAGNLDMCGGGLRYNGPRNRPALILGTDSAFAQYRNYVNLDVVSVDFAGASAITWPAAATLPTDVLGKDGRYVGVRLLNVYQSKISTAKIRGFNIGLDLYAGEAAFTVATAYNTLHIGRHENNYISICLRSVGGAIDSFVNENVFFGGNCTNRSSANGLGSAYGVVFTWDKVASYRGQNNNRFYGMTFELGNVSPRTPVYFDGAGAYNHFLDFRSESNNGPFAIVDGGGTVLSNNYFRAAFDLSAGATRNAVQELGGAVGNVYETSALQQRQRSSWNSGRIVDRVSGRVANTPYLAGDLFLTDSSGGAYRTRTNAGFKTMRNHFVVPNGFGVGVQIDTSRIKTLILRHAFRTGFGGRISVQCFDASGALLTSAGPNHPYVNSTLALNYGSAYGGSYTGGSDNNTSILVTVHADVQSIRFIVGGGTNPLHLGSMEVIAMMDQMTTAGVTVYSGLSIGGGIPGANEFFSSAKPDTAGEHGVYRRGQLVLNDAAAVGAPSHWTAITSEIAYLGKAWTASTSYPFVDEIAINGTNAYVVKTPGTSAASGGPTGTGTAIADGTVVWDYLGPKAVFATSPNLV